ncbi:B12-binding domain-containing radical SAM protein [Bacillus massilinigeriensis]|uniref:B12-binding domain-containing radical SAM protein n=1 Tax=Bacillus massilionigeriensis TaxID=1805475 RepID=UPI00096AE920|nr:B12-binding domain-containing radical SAM protein [Bacillus massilionigeriensis]
MNIICTTLNAKFIHTNLAIRLLKAYAQPEFDIELTEYTIKDPVMNIVTDLYKRKPNIIGFSCYIWNIEETAKVAQMLKKIDPSIFIVIGGPEVTYNAQEWLERVEYFDAIVIGEGEEPFKQLLHELNSEQNLEKVRGIAFRKDGQIHMNLPQNKLDLRNIPSPFRFEEDLPHLSKRIVYIETSRGCPFTCQFCLSSIEVGVRYFDKAKVKEDILYLMKNGARVFKFVDRTFNISRSYAMDMFRFLIDEHLPGTVFQFEITADIMRPEVIEFLNKEAPPGLFRFEIGVQSTNDYTNELVKRKQNFEKLTRTVTMVKEGGKIDQHLDLIAGLPEEDYDSFKKTFNDVFALRPEELQLGFLKMLRGTGLTQQADEYQYVYSDFPPYEMVSNRILPFSDVIRIKQVEDVLEKYWNDHRMDHTVEYLVSKGFDTPFNFFQDFGSYWEEMGWSRIGHQLEDLFRRLFEFLKSINLPNLDIVEGLMKLDYLEKAKYKPRKPWWYRSFDKKDRSEFYQSLMNNPFLLGEGFANLGLLERDLYKYTLLEEVPFDLSEYLKSGKIIETPSCLLAYFDSKNEITTIYSCIFSMINK